MALNVLITGSKSGFGRLMSETLASRGHRVFAGMRDVEGRNAGPAAELRAFTHASGGTIAPVEIDIASTESVEAGVATALAAADGRIDVAINNAAMGSFGLSEGYTGDQVTQIFNTNVAGLQRVNRAVLPGMRARGDGLLIHIGSTIGRIVLPAMALYCATKFAVEAVVEGYAYELAPLGIEAVLVQPGAYPTGFMAGALVPADPRDAGYGANATLCEQFMAGLGPMMSGPDAPKPQAVADAVLRLIEAPAGQRPLRTVVDAYPEAVETINAACAQVQAGMLGMLGMGGLLKVTIRDPAA
jgi:NAD(P)-dependent dehydrogenase (short-subunit alcohol dehydrogenase family)